MKDRRVAAAAVLAVTLLSFFEFPGHTWLEQDTQIWVAVLEHQRDPAVLRYDPVAQPPLTAFTLYDGAALALRAATGLGWREVLTFEQLLTRGLGIWGVYLMATAAGLALGPALLVTAIVSLGAVIVGPAVLTFEYEPTPRAFAIGLVLCAVGLAAHRRFLWSGVAAACAFLYHPPTAVPFLVVFAWSWRPAIAGALVVLPSFGKLSALEEQLLRLRTSYVWISRWPHSVVLHWLLLGVIVAALWLRLRRRLPRELRLFSLGLPLLGLATMPVSWLLLEHSKWWIVPQLQPMRALVWVALMTQFLAALAGVFARSFLEATACFAVAFLLPLQPVITEPYRLQRVAVVLLMALASAAAVRWKAAPVAALAAFFAIPMLGGVVNYANLHTPELAQLSDWARRSTPPDAVFLFADAGRAYHPGVFRAEAQRAVYVDWKGGGQILYLRGFAPGWWSRWQETLGRGYHSGDLGRYGAMGIGYVVLSQPDASAGQPVFQNGRFVVYGTAR